MSVTIGHARCDENGKIDGALVGDQTGKEILIADWYVSSGGWTYYLEPIDKEMANRAARYMEQICADNNFGYSQKTRWTGHKSIVANDNTIPGARGNYDCSSLVISCYILAGLKHKASGYSKSITQSFMDTGMFRLYSKSEYLKSGKLSCRGGVYVNAGKHVAMVLKNTDNEELDTHDDPTCDVSDNINWDKAYVVVDKINDWCNVRERPDMSSKIIGRAHKGDEYKACDFDGTFFMIVYENSEAFIHGSLVTVHEGEAKVSHAGKRYVEVVFGKDRGKSGSVNVRKVPRTGKVIYIARTGEKFEILETADNGFYLIDTPKGQGYISCNKPYTEVIEE